VNGSQGGYRIFADDPLKVRIPDVSFTRRDRLPGGKPEPGHGRVAPDLAVEVLSPNDLASDVQVKVLDYLGAGVALVWVVDPPSRSVWVYRPDGSGEFLQEQATLDGGSVLPGFACPVAAIFEGL
jgi:Uma2 family endonuclease